MQDSSKPPQLKKSDIFFIRTILAILIFGFCIIIALQFGSNYILRSFIEKEKGIANLISLSASQRLHSQRIGLLTFLSISTKSEDTKERILRSLKDQINAMKKTQDVLTSGTEVTWKVQGYSKEVNRIFYEEPFNLNDRARTFLSKANNFVNEKLEDEKTQKDRANELTEISSELLIGFSTLTEQFREEGIKGIDNLSKNTQLIFIISSLVVILVAIYVLVPLYRYLKSELISKNKYLFELENRNSELSDFASIVAHDLKAPLANILGFNTILKDRITTQNSPLQLNLIESIDQCTQKMSSMISDLLTYARLSAATGNFEEFPLEEVCKKVTSQFEVELAQINGSIECINLPVVKGSQIKCEHLFHNLISNAIKYRNKEQDLKIVIFEVESKDKNYTKIVIEDNGRGLPLGLENYIFEPFKRLSSDDSIEGSGLGLALCKKIVEQHGGKIRAKHSNSLGGACFEFSLPVPNKN